MRFSCRLDQWCGKTCHHLSKFFYPDCISNFRRFRQQNNGNIPWFMKWECSVEIQSLKQPHFAMPNYAKGLPLQVEMLNNAGVLSTPFSSKICAGHLIEQFFITVCTICHGTENLYIEESQGAPDNLRTYPLP